MRKAIYGILLLSALVFALVLRQHHNRVQASSTARRVLYYVDPMHPSYKSDKPGVAPDCGMQLVPVYADEGAPVAASGEPAPATPGAVSIDPERQQLVGISVVMVEKASATRALRIPGRVTADETRVYRINAGVDGLVKETYEAGVGSQVKKDQRLASVYSPDFLAPAGGYLTATERSQADAAKDAAPRIEGRTGVRGWTDRLRALGMSDSQIEELNSTRKLPDDIYVLSPANGFILARNISVGQRFEKHMEFYRVADLSHVWIVADLFPDQAQYFHPGAVARITLPGQARSFSARVSDVLPQIDPDTRTLKLRLETDNKDFALRPDMFVDVDLTVAAPPGLSVPADAVLDSGLYKRVFVARGNGIFEPREVVTGERFGDRVQVLRGLAEGERVVASGTFLVDSESRLRSGAESAHQPAAKHAGNNGSKYGGSGAEDAR